MTHTSFGRYWAAATLSSMGTAVTTVAIPVLVVQGLHASAFEVGVVNAAQFVPDAVLGLLAGVYADRWRRQRILEHSSLGPAATLGAVPVLWRCGVARGVDPGRAAAGVRHVLGVRVRGDPVVGAAAGPDTPAARGQRPTRPDRCRRRVRWRIGSGLRWTYRHRTLAPLAVSTHVRFVANAAGSTALTVVAPARWVCRRSPSECWLRPVGSPASSATVAPAIGRRAGPGAAILATRTVYPVAWVLVATAPDLPAGSAASLGAALRLLGLAMGVENANDTTYWQRDTPDRLLGRVNATRRSANRTAGDLGAVLGGTALTVAGHGPTLFGVATLSAVSAAVIAVSSLRGVRES